MRPELLKYKFCLFLLLQAGIVFSQQGTDIAPPDVYTTAEQMPSFPGGRDALSKYVRKQLGYPESAVKNGVHGTVMVRFVVEADGQVTHPEIVKSLDAACDKEAVRVIAGMPAWDPGMQNGRFVAVYYNLPITFAMF